MFSRVLSRLFFSAQALSVLRAHSASCAPREACGALLGRGERVFEALPLINASPTPSVAYLIGARELLSTEREAERLGLEVIGYFHSHPSSAARPSVRDLAEAVPGSVTVIVSGDEVTAWCATGSAFKEIEVIDR